MKLLPCDTSESFCFSCNVRILVSHISSIMEKSYNWRWCRCLFVRGSLCMRYMNSMHFRNRSVDLPTLCSYKMLKSFQEMLVVLFFPLWYHTQTHEKVFSSHMKYRRSNFFSLPRESNIYFSRNFYLTKFRSHGEEKATGSIWNGKVNRNRKKNLSMIFDFISCSKSQSVHSLRELHLLMFCTDVKFTGSQYNGNSSIIDMISLYTKVLSLQNRLALRVSMEIPDHDR